MLTNSLLSRPQRVQPIATVAFALLFVCSSAVAQESDSGHAVSVLAAKMIAAAQDRSLPETELKALIDAADRTIASIEEMQMKASPKQRAALEATLTQLRDAREKLRALRLATLPPGPAAPSLRATAFTRMAVGLEQAAASAADPEQAFALDFSVNAPLRRPRNYLLRQSEAEKRAKQDEMLAEAQNLTGEARAAALREADRLLPTVCERRINETDLMAFNPSVQLWANFRFTSVPQQVSTEVQSVAIASSVRALKANELVKGVTFLGGPEVRIWRGACFPAENEDENALFSAWLFVGAGAITPFKSDDTFDLFVLDSDVESQLAFPQELRGSGKKYVAFVAPDRSHFLWQYYFGLRFKTDYLDSDGRRLRYPGVIDLAVGRNEAVTGDRKTWVLRLEAFYPLPFEPAKFVYVFGGAAMALKNADNQPLLVANAPTAVVPVPGPDVLMVQRPNKGRDAWKVGVAIDLLELFKGDEKKK